LKKSAPTPKLGTLSRINLEAKLPSDILKHMKKIAQKNQFFTAVFKKCRGGYTAWIEEMPGVISEGKTKREAQSNLEDALALMLETNRLMTTKDVAGKLERVSISIPYQYA
jgi:predicted RNase H-like HicB family nuclease